MKDDKYKEEVLPDDYPIYPEYYYLIDGKPQRSNIMGRVSDLKLAFKCKEVRRCDMVARKLAEPRKR